jgi:transaldolase
MKKCKIFYDGVNIKDFIDQVDGVTTNTSFLAAAEITDYNKFIEESLSVVNGKPISFQVTKRDIEGIESQARYLSSLGENIYVKIPIILPDESTTETLIKKLSDEGIKVNVTCIHTMEQIELAVNAVNKNTPSIISVFSGGISDSGTYPEEYIKYAVELTQEYNSDVLWAGCQRVLSIIESNDLGCGIVTVPDNIMRKRNRIGISVYNTSVKKSQTFFNDGDKLNLSY